MIASSATASSKAGPTTWPHLLAQGAGPEVRVGLVVERSLEMIVAILATLKAGAAYAPMDPSAQASACAHDGRQRHRPAAGAAAPGGTCRVRRTYTELMLEPELRRGRADPRRAATGLQPRQLAYVIYTSGSTGQPEAVLLLPSESTSCACLERWFDFGPDRTLFHSYAFELLGMGDLGALKWNHGGRLVIVPHETCRSTRISTRCCTAKASRY
ncbi:AMP-binding protein [Pseudomonas sp. BNK-44-a]|uniref:AMP-binding protein n=1 Tax=Pseudomonas sp. BNK-44-a TaxID=3376178 RepID=UPI0039BF596D